MQRTIQIGDKYKPLMDYYSEKFDKEEFNVFITKLLIAYKKMKDKNIDLITLTELLEPYDINIIDLIKIVSENAKMLEPSLKEAEAFVSPDRPEETWKREARQNSSVRLNGETKTEKQQQKPINPILNLGIDLSQ